MTTTPDVLARRYVLTHAEGSNPHHSAWFASIDECKAYMRSLGKPARIYDRLEDKRGTIYPSGSMRWNAR